MNDNVVDLAAVFGIFVVPVLGWIAVRYLSHRERIEMIRHGIVPPAGRMRDRDWRGAVGMPGIAATPAPRPSFDADVTLEGARIVLRRGIRLTFIGVALTIGLSFVGYHDGPIGPTWVPGPWLLGGLVPLFIGLAQVTMAMLSGATLGVGQTGPATSPPPVPPFDAMPHVEPPVYGSSYTYRPGETQELRTPKPPERR
jgi:hypothetical protein